MNLVFLCSCGQEHERMCKTVNLRMSSHNLAMFWSQNAANAAAVRRLLSSLPYLTSPLDCRLQIADCRPSARQKMGCEYTD